MRAKPPFRRGLALSIAVLGCLFAMGRAVQAQISPFGGETSKGLTEDDLQLLLRATHTINHGSLLRPGQARSWTNPESGAHGEVAFVGAAQDAGMACHKLRNTIYVADQPDPGVYDLNWCLTNSGSWRIKG